jgi:phosphonate degradation associated HDIG domain protein
MTQIIDELLALLEVRGRAAYGREAVSQHEHAVQAAMLAEAASAGPALIAAALLHDIGHLVEDSDALAAERGIDAVHELVGAHYLRGVFPPAVSEPVALHVPAKRYLCATEPGYRAALSPASEHSLMLQGGIFSSAEAALFKAGPHADAAIALRRWDDEAKIPGLKLTALEHYRPILQAALHGH